MPWLIGGGLALGALGSIVSGSSQSKAAKESAAIQAQAARDAAEMQAQTAEKQIAAQQEAAAIQRADLNPFVQQGLGFMPQQQQAVDQTQALFGPNAGETMMANPMFQAIQAQNQQDIMQNAAVRGRLGTGGTQTHLQDAALRTGFDILNQERSAQLQNAGFLANLVGQGQSAAAGQGAAAIQTGQGISGTLGQSAANQGNLLTSGAAATAAGQVGAANANTQMWGNLANLGMTAAQLYKPAPTPAAVPLSTSTTVGVG